MHRIPSVRPARCSGNKISPSFYHTLSAETKNSVRGHTCMTTRSLMRLNPGPIAPLNPDVPNANRLPMRPLYNQKMNATTKSHNVPVKGGSSGSGIGISSNKENAQRKHIISARRVVAVALVGKQLLLCGVRVRRVCYHRGGGGGRGVPPGAKQRNGEGRACQVVGLGTRVRFGFGGRETTGATEYPNMGGNMREAVSTFGARGGPGTCILYVCMS